MMRRSLAALALIGAAAAACDSFPTEPPMWEQTWVVPGETIELGVAELLPADVGVNDDTTAFVASVDGASMTLSLAEMCGAPCTVLDGFVAPKPAFRDTISMTTALPSDLVSATLAGGSFQMTLEHDLNFDPLRPSSDPAAERGTLGIRVTSDGNVVADTTISGDVQPFPAGVPLTPTLTIRPVAVANDLQIEVAIYSPAGDDVLIESPDTAGATVEPATVLISEATVVASELTVDPTVTELDFSGIEADGVVVENIQRGAIRFHVQNPFTVTGTLSVRFELPGETIERTIQVEEGTYSARVELTGDELRRILGSDQVNVVASGTATPTGGTVTVTPDQELVLQNEFELVLLVGGSEEG